jgi:hypothetical protein
MNFFLSEPKNWRFFHAYTISCTCNCQPMFFYCKFECLCMLSTSASGWQKILFSHIALRFWNATFPIQNKWEVQVVVIQYLYGLPAKNSLGSKHAITVCEQSCGENLCLARKYSWWLKCPPPNFVLYQNFLYICNINVTMFSCYNEVPVVSHTHYIVILLYIIKS